MGDTNISLVHKLIKKYKLVKYTADATNRLSTIQQVRLNFITKLIIADSDRNTFVFDSCDLSIN